MNPTKEIGNSKTDLEHSLSNYISDNVPILDKETWDNTPHRYVQALEELLSGYKANISEFMTRDFDEPTDQMVAVKVPFSSLCTHHLLPFTGEVSIAYLPTKRVLGLSKFSRLVDALSRRLQVQERLTVQIADEIEKYLKPRGVMIVVHSKHTCVSIRGARKDGSMTTSVIRGKFRGSSLAREEALELFKLNHT